MRLSQINLSVFSICLLLVGAHSGRAETTQPNVIYFLVDDLGREDCGFMGGKEIRTPNIDKLAAGGARLDAYYVQPLCSPTRAALLTGRYPMRHGLQKGVVKPWARYGLPLEETTIADDLTAAGYATGIFGKWHLGHFDPAYLPTKRGFTRQYGHYNGALDYFTHQRDGGHDWHSDDRVSHDEGYATDLIGQRAAEFIAEHAGKRPFFAYVPFNAVHSPYQPPKDGAEAYPNLKGQRRNYAAMLTSVDDAVGRIVEAVENAGQRDNTLFIFSSDNGGPAPGRISDNGDYRDGKGSLYEGGVRVAAFATLKGKIPEGGTITEPMHAVDWRPTLQKLCGAATSNDLPMDGVNIWPTLTEGAPSPHDVILLNTTPDVGAIRAGDWKLIVRQTAARPRPRARRRQVQQGQDVELYNLNEDPYERTNLADQEPAKVKELKSRLAKFAEQAAPPKAGPEPESFKAPKVWGEAG
jgi:arylsulfatase A-like enzyme